MAADQVDGQGRDDARARLVQLTARSTTTAGADHGRGVARGHLRAVGWVPRPPDLRGLQSPDAHDADVPVGDVHGVDGQGVDVQGMDAAIPGALRRDDDAALDGGTSGVPVPGRPPSQAEVRGEAAAIRERALSSAIRAYTAAHGHPLEHPSPDVEQATHRWAMRARAAVAVAVVLGLLCGAVVVRAMAQVPEDVDLSHLAAGPAADGTPADGAGTTTRSAPSGSAGAADVAADPGGRASAGDVPDDPLARGASDAGPAGTSADGRALVLHVIGEVVAPGIVVLGAGARVVDAIEAAGGATDGADLTALNLAREVSDGEQVHVPAPGEQVLGSAQSPPAGSRAPGTPTVVDLNAVDATGLVGLPGVGPVLAERILDWRVEHGPFRSVDELAEVSGIGPAVLAGLRDRVRV